MWQTKELQRAILEVWQAKGLRAGFSDLWQTREKGRARGSRGEKNRAAGTHWVLRDRTTSPARIRKPLYYIITFCQAVNRSRKPGLCDVDDDTETHWRRERGAGLLVNSTSRPSLARKCMNRSVEKLESWSRKRREAFKAVRWAAVWA